MGSRTVPPDFPSDKRPSDESEWASTQLSTTAASARSGAPLDMFFAFGGVNLAVTNLGGGALGIALGLSLSDVLTVYLVGGAIGSLTIGACVVQAKRTGSSIMVNSRPAFGYIANRALTVLMFLMTACWFGVNNFFGVTAARSIVSGLGGPASRGIDLLLLVSVMALLVLIAIFGYKWIIRYQRLTVFVMGLALITVAIGAVSSGVDWGHAGSVSGGERLAAIITLTTALGIGWAVSWTPYSADFARHLRTESSDRGSFICAWAGMFAFSTLTFGLSAIIASGSAAGFDVGETVLSALPGGIGVPVLIVMTVGLLPANLANLLVGPAMLETLDLRLTRVVAVSITALCGLPIAVAGVFQPSFGTMFQGWMLTLVICLGPWLSIILIDFFVLHRGEYRREDLFSRTSGVAGEVFLPGVVAWIVGVVVAFMFGNTPVFESPLVKAYLTGADVSLFVGAVIGAAIYWPWATRRKRDALAERRTQMRVETPGSDDPTPVL